VPESRVIGRMQDVDGVPVTFSLNRDGTLRIWIGRTAPPLDGGTADLDGAKAEEFGQLFIAGAWSAGVRSAHLDAEETREADGGPPSMICTACQAPVRWNRAAQGYLHTDENAPMDHGTVLSPEEAEADGGDTMAGGDGDG
jgi:hypothetical protein